MKCEKCPRETDEPEVQQRVVTTSDEENPTEKLGVATLCSSCWDALRDDIRKLL